MKKPYTKKLHEAVQRWRTGYHEDLRAVVISDLDIVASNTEPEENEYAQARRAAVKLLVSAGDDRAFFSEQYNLAYPDPPLPIGVIPRRIPEETPAENRLIIVRLDPP